MTTITTSLAPTVSLIPIPSPVTALPDAGNVNLFPIKLRIPNAVVAVGADACEAWFWEVCLANDDSLWQMELGADGVLELMPSYAYAERREFRLGFALETWNIGLEMPGMTTGPSAAYRLSNGAVRSPDGAWTAAENVVPPRTDPPQTWPFCPDFVVEIRSPSQSRPSDLAYLRDKMREYMDNGARLGWLIDPLERTVRIYRAGVGEPELRREPELLDGEDVLPGFTFAVRRLIFDLA